MPRKSGHMTVVNRRTFYGKAGKADAIVALLQEGGKTFVKNGVKLHYRILTDHNSGRTDRVVWEWEGESVEAIVATVRQARARAQEAFGASSGKLSEMITHVEMDNFTVR